MWDRYTPGYTSYSAPVHLTCYNATSGKLIATVQDEYFASNAITVGNLSIAVARPYNSPNQLGYVDFLTGEVLAYANFSLSFLGGFGYAPSAPESLFLVAYDRYDLFLLQFNIAPTAPTLLATVPLAKNLSNAFGEIAATKSYVVVSQIFSNTIYIYKSRL